MWVGRRAGVVESGTTKTVVARSWELRASIETITTGRSFFSGGSVGSLTNHISPRCGDRDSRLGVVMAWNHICDSENFPHSLSFFISSSESES